MDKYFRIKKDKLDSYTNLNKAFVDFPCFLFDVNKSADGLMYYYWRLKPNSQDESVLSKIKTEDLEEVDVNGNVICG